MRGVGRAAGRAAGADPRGRVGLDATLRLRWIDLAISASREPDLASVRFAGILADLCRGPDEPGRPGPARGFPELFRWIEERMAEPLTAADLAAAAAMSLPNFNRRFREAAGLSPMRYLAQQRVSRARTLLRGSDQTVASIATAVGYPDPYHFSRVYKRLTGRAPSADREPLDAMR